MRRESTTETEALRNPAQAVRAIAPIVAEAGEIALRMRRAGVRTWSKASDSPVTEADIAVDEFLRDRLLALAPGHVWQSEESSAAGKDLRRSWIVDPIDGTRAYMRGDPDWSIACALVEDGLPIAAALHAPATGELFLAEAGGGATRNGQRIAAANAALLAGARIAGPRGVLNELAKRGLEFTAVPRIHSLALRFARVASGEIDAALSSADAHDWDLAAADLIVHEAGGRLTALDGTRPRYGLSDARHAPLAAAGLSMHPALLAALRAAHASPAPKVAQP